MDMYQKRKIRKENKKNKKFGSHSIVEPVYDREPNIGISKKTLVH